MKSAGLKASDLKKAGFGANALRAAGYSAGDLVGAGFDKDELASAGYTPGEIFRAGASDQHNSDDDSDDDKAVSDLCRKEVLQAAYKKGISATKVASSFCVHSIVIFSFEISARNDIF